MIFDIKPYEGVGPFRFGMNEDEVRAHIRQDIKRVIDREGNICYQLIECRMCFDKETEKLVSIGLYPESNAMYDGLQLFHDESAFVKMIKLDGSPFETVGFIVLLNLGMTMAGYHDNDESQKSITVFTRGLWDKFRDSFNPFDIDEYMKQSGLS